MIKIDLKVEGASPEQIKKYEEIFRILIEKGALDGVRAGSSILHFDHNCVFQGVELSYFPWKRRRQEKEGNSYFIAPAATDEDMEAIE